jgi:hypothetical protein
MSSMTLPSVSARHTRLVGRHPGVREHCILPPVERTQLEPASSYHTHSLRRPSNIAQKVRAAASGREAL